MEAGRTCASISGPASPRTPSFCLPGPLQKGHVQWKSQSRHSPATAPMKPDDESLLAGLAAPDSKHGLLLLSPYRGREAELATCCFQWFLSFLGRPQALFCPMAFTHAVPFTQLG